MLADALQKVFEIRHRNILYFFSKLGDVVQHHLAESIVAYLRQIGMFKMFQSFQCWIMPTKQIGYL
jgi:hypothetical protein